MKAYLDQGLFEPAIKDRASDSLKLPFRILQTNQDLLRYDRIKNGWPNPAAFAGQFEVERFSPPSPTPL